MPEDRSTATAATGTAATATTPRFAIFRAGDALGEAEAGIMDYVPLPTAANEGSHLAQQAGVHAGHQLKVLFSVPGFSLVYVWFKSGFPLPRHTHNVDCLYYIVGGSLKLGTEELKAGDGFFIGKDVPYTYTPGEAGVEVLEFRASNKFNIDVLASNPAFWSQAVATVQARRDAWATERQPGLAAS
ncbi:MAG TPA: hypothetical protein VHZ99_11920 [Steroidobacteraceae bacterium]|jgi:quercetin dioxygenase-like cupin family protein|nr:hypothetical protein [Steroidobacteraceae bacterium]